MPFPQVMEEAPTLLPVNSHPAAVDFPELPGSQEFVDHTQRSFLHPRYEELKTLERLLSEYSAALAEYRKSCAVRAHGFTDVRELLVQYREHLKLRNFQRRYCVERARWEPGLTLEQQALVHLANQAAIDAHEAQIIRDTVHALFHHDRALSSDSSTEHLEAAQREEQALGILGWVEQVPAGRRAIEDLKRAATLLNDNASAGEWLAKVDEPGQPPVTLAEMQGLLSETQREIELIHDHLQKKRRHLIAYNEHVQEIRMKTAGRLMEVCSCFHKLRDEHFEDFVRRNKDGFLSRMYESIKHAENVGARGGYGTYGLDARLRFG